MLLGQDFSISRFHRGGSRACVPREHLELTEPGLRHRCQPPSPPSVKRASAETASEHRSSRLLGKRRVREEEGRDKRSPSEAAWALCPDPARRHNPGQVHLDLPNPHANTEVDSTLKRARGAAFLLCADGKTRCLTGSERAAGRTQKSIFSLTKTSSSAETCQPSGGQLVATGFSPMTLHPANANNKIHSSFCIKCGLGLLKTSRT